MPLGDDEIVPAAMLDDATKIWLPAALERLATRPRCGYRSDQAPSAEPTALAALALTRHGYETPAAVALDWLAAAQQSDGRIATAETPGAPGWPTALAVLAWHTATQRRAGWESAQARGVEWLLAARGKPEPNHRQMGHDMTLVGWSWVENTHSWIEPTAMAVLALKAVGQAQHPRVREAVRMLWNRQLPTGGFNYGNTFVLGQMLRPHLLPTGLALAALADEPDATAKLHRSCELLRNKLSDQSPAASLAYALFGLAACRQEPEEAPDWLASAYRRSQQLDLRSTWISALLCLAAAPSAGLVGAPV